MKYRNSIIIEGPDCAGKTTLAKRLKEYFTNETDIVHCTGHDPKDYDFYHQTLRKMNVIYDRHFIGEMIYPEVFNRKHNLSNESFIDLLEEAKELNSVIIIITPPNEVLLNRLNSERPNEEVEVKNNILMINNKFANIAKNIAHYKNVIWEQPLDGQIDINKIINKITEIQGGN